MSESYLYELERGTRGTRATLDVLRRIAGAAECSPGVFRSYRQAVVCQDHPELVDDLYRQLHRDGEAVA